MKREQAAVGRAKRGKGARGKRELRKRRAVQESVHRQRLITKTGAVWPTGGTVRL